MGGEFRGRMDTCICMPASPQCSPEIITTLLIGYTSIQSKKLKKKLKNKYIKTKTSASSPCLRTPLLGTVRAAGVRLTSIFRSAVCSKGQDRRVK